MLAGRLQRRTTTPATRMEDAFRVRLHLPSAPGSGAALCQELRASSRRSHRPTGQPKRQERTQNWIKLGGNVTRRPPDWTMSTDRSLRRLHGLPGEERKYNYEN